MEGVQNNEEMVTELRKLGAEFVLVKTVTFCCTVKIVNGISMRTKESCRDDVSDVFE
jgi:hypothetical protein